MIDLKELAQGVAAAGNLKSAGLAFRLGVSEWLILQLHPKAVWRQNSFPLGALERLGIEFVL